MTIALEHHGGLDLAAPVKEDAMRTAIVGYLGKQFSRRCRCIVATPRVPGSWEIGR